MANEQIEFLREWLADKSSKTEEELRQNRDAAQVCEMACSFATASASARDDEDSFLYADHVKGLVKEYEVLTNGQN